MLATTSNMSITDFSESRMIDMKSIQPYSTRDEYLYAMKEDLADWFNCMYADHSEVPHIYPETFIEQLENGVLICNHANSVMKMAATRTHVFESIDLQNAGIVGSKSLLATPNSKSVNWTGEFVLYRADAKPQTFQVSDIFLNNISIILYMLF